MEQQGFIICHDCAPVFVSIQYVLCVMRDYKHQIGLLASRKSVGGHSFECKCQRRIVVRVALGEKQSAHWIPTRLLRDGSREVAQLWV